MTETTYGRTRQAADDGHESTWGASEEIKRAWAQAHPAAPVGEQLPAQAPSQPGPTYKNPNAA
jgi:hypothetical protein